MVDVDSIMGIDWTRVSRSKEVFINFYTVGNPAFYDSLYNLKDNGDSLDFTPDFVRLRYANATQQIGVSANTANPTNLPWYLWSSLTNNVICPLLRYNSRVYGTPTAGIGITGENNSIDYGKTNIIIPLGKTVEEIRFKALTQVGSSATPFNTWIYGGLTNNISICLEFIKI